jgi:hypothetical protein
MPLPLLDPEYITVISRGECVGVVAAWFIAKICQSFVTDTQVAVVSIKVMCQLGKKSQRYVTI